MRISKLFRKIKVASLGDFINLLKSSRKPHVRIYLSGNHSAGSQWAYVMRVEARLKSGELAFVESEGRISLENIRAGEEEMIFANRRILSEPVEETARTVLMFFPDSKIMVWDMYSKPRGLEEFRIHMQA